MYEAYWGLKEKPFENTPDPRFIYYTEQHQEALSRMLYVVREKKGAAFLTGEYGSGKTLLSRILLQELEGENKYQSAFIFNPRLSGAELIKEIIYQFQGSRKEAADKAELFHALHKILLTNHDVGRHSVIVIDEAQAIIDKDAFEELRLLLNFQLNDAFLLTIILFGQPDLIGKILELPQLRQRMSVRYHLQALNQQESKQYIQHRLKVAGTTQAIFEESAYKEIFSRSGGIPRQINNICDLALLAVFGNEARTIKKKDIKQVSEELEGEDISSDKNS